MNNNLLIVGAGCCGLSAKEIAESMGCFGKISFLDDNIRKMPDGSQVLGTVHEYENFAVEYGNIFVAIGNPKIKLDDLMKIVKGPDFPTGAYIIANEELRNAYETGKGKITVRSKVSVETEKSGKQNIVITEIPFQVNK